MATAVPSRFAVLSIEDDDYKPKKNSKTNAGGKTNSKNKQDKQKQQSKKDEKKKQCKGKKNKNNEDQQWEQWKEKDSMAVEETFEQELHEAILLSKLTYQANAQITTRIDKEQNQTKKAQNVKRSKKATMSLEEFNNLSSPTAELERIDCKPQGKAVTETDTEYFERVEKEVKEEITKGREKDMLQARLNQIDDDITSAQLRVELEKRDDTINQLKEEIGTLKNELIQVKNRNKKVYQILLQGEMKDKASALIEVAKLQEIRNELTSEVASLHVQLEQERSKTRASSVDLKSTKQSNKKRPASDNA